MIRQGADRIVKIASTVGLAAMRLQSPFVAAKTGFIHLTPSMALELAPKGILANALAPGSTLTAVIRKLFYGEGGSFQRHRRVPEARAACAPGGTRGDRARGALTCRAGQQLRQQPLPHDRRWLNRRLLDVRRLRP